MDVVARLLQPLAGREVFLQTLIQGCRRADPSQCTTCERLGCAVLCRGSPTYASPRASVCTRWHVFVEAWRESCLPSFHGLSGRAPPQLSQPTHSKNTHSYYENEAYIILLLASLLLPHSPATLLGCHGWGTPCCHHGASGSPGEALSLQSAAS